MEGELAEWMERDPITLYRRHLIKSGALDEPRAAALAAEVEARIEDCIERTMASEMADVASMFRHVTASTGSRGR